MQQQFLKKEQRSSLLIFFAGYAQDETPFSYFKEVQDSDVMLVCDYEDESFEVAPLLEYEQIRLMAWSMGVCMAAYVFREYELMPRLKQATAINGTIEGIDESLGISPVLWEATKNALSAQSLEKFYLRMTGSREACLSYKKHAPQRSLSSLYGELSFLQEFCAGTKTEWNCFNDAYVAQNDRIFPPLAQERSWKAKKHVTLHTLCGPHYDENLFRERLHGR